VIWATIGIKSLGFECFSPTAAAAAMSTSSSRARRFADTTKAPGAGGNDAAAQARKARIEAADAAAAQGAQAAQAAAAAVEVAAALRAKIDEEEVVEAEDSDGSHQSKNRYRRPSQSPPRRRERHGRSPAMQIYREIGGGWPMLTRSNYYEWSLLMKVKLLEHFLWDAIKFDDVDYEQDRRALEAICAAVPLEIGATIANKPTAKLAGRRLRPGACERPRSSRHAPAPQGRVRRSHLSPRQAS